MKALTMPLPTKSRITTGIRRAMKAGFIVQVGTRYRMGGLTREGFDIEEVLPGEPPVMLPDGKPTTDLHTMRVIRQIWGWQLMLKDAAELLGVSAERIALRYDADSQAWTVSIIGAK